MRCCLPLLILALLISSPTAADIITGAGPGAGPHVKVFSGNSGSELQSFFAYALSFGGGVRVAAGDVNNDGFGDIVTSTGAGAAGHVKVFDGSTGGELSSFFAYGGGFNGGVFVASGDIDGDGFADIVTGADAGAAPHVKVFSGQTGSELLSFFAYDALFDGGVRVAAGDVNADGFDDLITGAGAAGHVKVFDGSTGGELSSFFAYGGGFNGGVFVASGDIDGDGFADIVTGADAGAAPHVKLFSGQTGSELLSFFAYDALFDGGVRVAAGDVDGDGSLEIITGVGEGAGGGPHVKVFDGGTGAELYSFLAYDRTFSGGVYVAANFTIPEPTGVVLIAMGVMALLPSRRILGSLPAVSR